MWEVFEHTADLGLRITAPTLQDLVAESGRALFSMMVANLQVVQPVEQVAVQVHGTPEQPDYLLFDWLAELLYVFETRQLVLCRFDVHLQADGIQGTCGGEHLDLERHDLHHEIKAVTYHGLSVRRNKQQWEAEVVLDL